MLHLCIGLKENSIEIFFFNNTKSTETSVDDFFNKI